MTATDVSMLGLCRRSIISAECHKQVPTALKSLLNFELFDKFLTYAGILFLKLLPDIKLLQEQGVDHLSLTSHSNNLSSASSSMFSPRLV